MPNPSLQSSGKQADNKRFRYIQVIWIIFFEFMYPNVYFCLIIANYCLVYCQIAVFCYAIFYFPLHIRDVYNRNFYLWKSQPWTIHNLEQISHNNKWCPNLACVHRHWPIVSSACQTMKLNVTKMWQNRMLFQSLLSFIITS